jgi:hypothetical protein
MSRAYAESTSVPTDKSIAEIRQTLRRYGATGFMHAERASDAVIVFEMAERRIMFKLVMPSRSDRRFTHTEAKNQARTQAAAEAAWEQACRARWRSLGLVVKAKLEAVAAGIVEFEDEFMAQIVMPDGKTFSEHARPKIALAFDQREMPPLLPHFGGPRS